MAKETDPNTANNTVGRVVLPPSSHERAAPAQPAGPGTPDREGGHLTRAGMVAAINAGGSVTIGGRVYSRAADLPGDDVIAAHRKQVAQDHAAQRAKMDGTPAPTPAPAK